jgi:hypothetical protein
METESFIQPLERRREPTTNSNNDTWAVSSFSMCSLATTATTTRHTAPVEKVFEILLVHMLLRNFLSPSSVFCLRRTNKSVQNLVDNPLIWQMFIQRYDGLPQGIPWVTKALSESSSTYVKIPKELGLFRDFLYLERIITLRPIVESRYNEDYWCTVTRIGFKRTCMFLEFCVRGNMSLGRLQAPPYSKLQWIRHDKSPNAVNCRRPDKIELITSNERYCHEGFLFYTIDFNRLMNCDLYFQYGSNGYSVQKLLSLNQDFCNKHHLLQLQTCSSRDFVWLYQ